MRLLNALEFKQIAAGNADTTTAEEDIVIDEELRQLLLSMSHVCSNYSLPLTILATSVLISSTPSALAGAWLAHDLGRDYVKSIVTRPKNK